MNYYLSGREIAVDEGAESRYKTALEDARRICRKMERGDWVDDWPGLVKELAEIVDTALSTKEDL